MINKPIFILNYTYASFFFVRLYSLDKMTFGATQAVEKEYVMEVPPIENYSDIHGDTAVPDLQLSFLNHYLESNEKQMDISKISTLYQER